MLREKEEPEMLEKSTVTYIWRSVEPDAGKSYNYYLWGFKTQYGLAVKDTFDIRLNGYYKL